MNVQFFYLNGIQSAAILEKNSLTLLPVIVSLAIAGTVCCTCACLVNARTLRVFHSDAHIARGPSSPHQLRLRTMQERGVQRWHMCFVGHICVYFRLSPSVREPRLDSLSQLQAPLYTILQLLYLEVGLPKLLSFYLLVISEIILNIQHSLVLQQISQ